jgi:hypothetical protein
MLSSLSENELLRLIRTSSLSENEGRLRRLQFLSNVSLSNELLSHEFLEARSKETRGHSSIMGLAEIEDWCVVLETQNR